MNAFEKALAGYIGEDNLMRIQKVKIGIAGAGGLGSNCAFNLVRSGFKKIKIVDFDCVEASNLDRQFYFYDQLGMPKADALRLNLERINPGLELVTVQEKLTHENILESFYDCDVVVEAFDKAECKAMLVESYYSSGKLLVSASGLGGWGKSDEIKVHRVHPKFFVIGDLVSEAGEGLPPISPRVNIAAAKQADVILSYVLNVMS